MISINLLPEAYRKPKATSAQQFHRSPLAGIVVGVLLVAVGLLWGLVSFHEARVSSLQGRVQALQPQKTEADGLRTSLDQLRQQERVFDQLARGRVSWARHLNLLSDATPDGVWYADLLVDDSKGLVLQGAAIGQGGEEMVRIGRLVQDLKADTSLSKTLTDIQIESIKRKQDGEIELVEFTLKAGLAATD